MPSSPPLGFASILFLQILMDVVSITLIFSCLLSDVSRQAPLRLLRLKHMFTLGILLPPLMFMLVQGMKIPTKEERASDSYTVCMPYLSGGSYFIECFFCMIHIFIQNLVDTMNSDDFHRTKAKICQICMCSIALGTGKIMLPYMTQLP